MEAARNETTALYQLLWNSTTSWYSFLNFDHFMYSMHHTFSHERSHIIWQDQSIVPSCVRRLNSTQRGLFSDSSYSIVQLNNMARAQVPPSTSILFQVWKTDHKNEISTNTKSFVLYRLGEGNLASWKIGFSSLIIKGCKMHSLR